MLRVWIATTILAFTLAPVGQGTPPLKEDVPEPWEVMHLKSLGISPRTENLLNYLQSSNRFEAELDQLGELVKKLGHANFKVRNETEVKLRQIGRVALPHLRAATKSDDAELAMRAKKVLQAVVEDNVYAIELYVVRALRRQQPEKMSEVFFQYLPFAQSSEIEREIWYGIDDTIRKSGKVPPFLIEGLKSPQISRRTLAGCVVALRGDAKQKKLAEELLDKEDDLVRLRVAQGFLAARSTIGVPTLIELATRKSPVIRWQAEELLYYLAGDFLPKEADGEFDAQGNRPPIDWAAWWKVNQGKIDLAKVQERPARPALFLEWPRYGPRETPNFEKGCRISLLGCDGVQRRFTKTEGGICELRCDEASGSLVMTHFIKDGDKATVGLSRMGIDGQDRKVLQKNIQTEGEDDFDWVSDLRIAANGEIEVLLNLGFKRFDGDQCVEKIKHVWHERDFRHTDLRFTPTGAILGLGSEESRFKFADDEKTPPKAPGWIAEFDRKTRKINQVYPLATYPYMRSRNLNIIDESRIQVYCSPESSREPLLEIPGAKSRNQPSRLCVDLRKSTESRPNEEEIILCLGEGKTLNNKPKGEDWRLIQIYQMQERNPANDLIWEYRRTGDIDFTPIFSLLRFGFDNSERVFQPLEEYRRAANRNQLASQRALMKLVSEQPLKEGGIETVRKYTCSPDEIVRSLAIKMAKQNPQICIKLFPELLQNVHESQYVTECRAIIEASGNEIIPCIIEDVNKTKHPQSIGMLGYFACRGSPEATKLMYAGLKETDDKIFQAYVNAVCQQAELAKEYVPELVKILKESKNENQVVSVIRALNWMGPTAHAAIPEMWSRFEDPRFRDKIPFSLAHLGKKDPAFVKDLVKRLNTCESRAIEANLMETVMWVGSFGADVSEAVPHLEKRLGDKTILGEYPDHSPRYLRDFAIQTLSHMGKSGKPSIKTLERLVRDVDEDRNVRQWALRMLESLDPEKAKSLSDLLKNQP